MIIKPLCIALFLTASALKTAAQVDLTGKSDSAVPKRPVFLLPQNFYNQHSGLFCKKEDQLQKRAGLNIFFRLGGKQYVDYLEKKPNSGRFPPNLHN